MRFLYHQNDWFVNVYTSQSISSKWGPGTTNWIDPACGCSSKTMSFWEAEIRNRMASPDFASRSAKGILISKTEPAPYWQWWSRMIQPSSLSFSNVVSIVPSSFWWREKMKEGRISSWKRKPRGFRANSHSQAVSETVKDSEKRPGVLWRVYFCRAFPDGHGNRCGSGYHFSDFELLVSGICVTGPPPG